MIKIKSFNAYQKHKLTKLTDNPVSGNNYRQFSFNGDTREILTLRQYSDWD